MGAVATGPRRARMEASPQYRHGTFHNEAATSTAEPGAMRDAARRMLTGRRLRRPRRPIPLIRSTAPTRTGLHLTWFGHASTLVEIDGARVLVDPVWSDRCSPSQQVGPRRLHEPPVGLGALGAVDVVLISHDHYDHLDMDTIRSLTSASTATFVVPLGIGAHLEAWGVPSARIVELDWDERVTVGAVTLVATPAQHFSGRGLSRDGTLWASWVVAGPTHRVFYTGDTGYFDGFARIGEEHGPFDATLVQVGAYDVAWPDIHMTPEEGVATHLTVGGGLLVPVHWCTFVLAPHPWAEPIERLLTEARARGVAVAVPRPGECVDVTTPPALDAWWRSLATS